MALTPDVAAGEIIQSAWGNEIRDRTIQVFANQADLTATWPDAPDGANAWIVDERTLMRRIGGAWVPTTQAGEVALTTNSGGGATITFPIPFPARPYVHAIDGDSGSAGLRVFGLVLGQQTETSCAFAVWHLAPSVGPHVSAAVRIVWVAFLR
jgi:hypothetical protein